MDLIYTDTNYVQSGVLTHFTLEHEEASEEGKNTFEVKASIDIPLQLGSLVYAEGTEYGGRITKIVTDTASSKTTCSGKTWLGMLEEKIIRPNTGEDYLIVSGGLNEIISALITRCNLSAFFVVGTAETITINNYKIDRYVSLFTALKKMLSKYNYKLNLSADDGVMKLAAVPITDFEETTEINSDLFSFKLTRQKYTCNHLIALGSGELSNRTVIDKYVQEDGSIGDTQFYIGTEEVCEIYDAPNIESTEELTKKATEKLIDKAKQDGLNITAYNLKADIGDKVTAKDLKQNISITQYVIDKIVTINDNLIKYQYKVGETL